MPDYKAGFLGQYIAAVEFGEKRPTMTIASVKLETLPTETGGEKDRWIVRFTEAKRGWVLNLTNAQLLAALFGSRNTDDWIGKRVTLRAEKVRLGGQMVDGIRVAGSPDLRAPLAVEVRLPRKRPATVTLVPTARPGNGAARQPAPEPPPDREPGDDGDEAQP